MDRGLGSAHRAFAVRLDASRDGDGFAAHDPFEGPTAGRARAGRAPTPAAAEDRTRSSRTRLLWLVLRHAALVALAIVLVSSSAFADGTEAASEQVKLIYRVPPGCPDKSAFLEVVTARTQRARFVDDDDAARRFTLEIWRQKAGYRGSLAIEEPGAEGTRRAPRRELAGARCEDLVRALALFTALAIDPAAESPSTVASPQSAPEEPTRPPPLPPPAPRPPPAPPAPTTPKTASAPERIGTKRGRTWTAGGGSGVFIAGGIARSMMASAHPVIEIASSGPLFSPSVRAGLVWATSSAQPAGPAELVLGLRAIVLSGCPLRVPIGSAVGLRLCAAVEGGALALRPSGIERVRSPVNPWLAIDPLARLEVRLLPGGLALEAEGGVAVPFTHLRSYVNPGPIIADTDAIGLRFGAAFVLQAF